VIITKPSPASQEHDSGVLVCCNISSWGIVGALEELFFRVENTHIVGLSSGPNFPETNLGVLAD